MPVKTHQELVLEEIVRQWPERVKARASLIGRPLGHDEVSDTKARELWNQINPQAAEIIVQSPTITPWEATKLLYPYREALLQAEKNSGGIKGMLRFVDRMNRTPKGESEPEREGVSADVY